jgi:hypothetical protein
MEEARSIIHDIHEFAADSKMITKKIRKSSENAQNLLHPKMCIGKSNSYRDSSER